MREHVKMLKLQTILTVLMHSEFSHTLCCPCQWVREIGEGGTDEAGRRGGLSTWAGGGGAGEFCAKG